MGETDSEHVTVSRTTDEAIDERFGEKENMGENIR